jgi:hypothetical protein
MPGLLVQDMAMGPVDAHLGRVARHQGAVLGTERGGGTLLLAEQEQLEV